jgi:hypothetical protein
MEVKMKINVFSILALILLVILCIPSLCFSEGGEGYFWKKMDKVQKSLFIMGYKMGSLDAMLTLNSLVSIKKEAIKPDGEVMDLANKYCTDVIEIIRKGVIKETYIPEEDLENIVEELDVFYTRERNLKVRISEAISKIIEEMYKKNPNLEKMLKLPGKK